MAHLAHCALLLLAALGAAGTAWAQEQDFSVSSIDTDLIDEETKAVVRLSERRFTVDGPGAATQRVRLAVTVLDEEARDKARFVVHHDKFRTIGRLEGRLRDESGEVIRTLQPSDQRDVSAISGFSLYDDNRVRLVELYHDDYPYTVEFEYEVAYDGLISWPSWRPQPPGGAPVERATFELSVPAGMEARYTTLGETNLEPTVTKKDGRRRLRWSVASRAGREPEPAGPSWGRQAGAVYTAPSRFSVGGRAGNMESWQKFGRWYYALAQRRDTLPPAAQRKVHALTDSLSSDSAKARRLYRYMQDRTRYVSVQLGLGGWQPFPATYVHERGYGDCKALTNYLQALLAEAGIESHPALIRSGVDAPAILDEFPSNQFNHVVLNAPNVGEDGLWLEATSQTMPFAHLGASTQDRHALLVTSEGGTLVRTPRPSPAANRQMRRARVTLKPSGDATAKVTTTYAGNRQDRVRRALADKTGRDRNKWLRNTLDVSSLRILRADYSDADAHRTELTLPVKLELPGYAARTGNRLFVKPNLMGRWTQVPPPMEQPRTEPVEYFPYPFADTDSIVFVPPEGYTVEALPDPVRIDAPFGSYRADVTQRPDGTLAYRRHFRISETTLPPEQYDRLRTFLGRIAQADRAQMVLVKK